MVSIENVTVISISTFEELQSIIQRGSEQRHTSGTQMNEESSRSHLILSIVIESTNLQTQSVARGKVSVTHIILDQTIRHYNFGYHLGNIMYMLIYFPLFILVKYKDACSYLYIQM